MASEYPTTPAMSTPATRASLPGSTWPDDVGAMLMAVQATTPKMSMRTIAGTPSGAYVSPAAPSSFSAFPPSTHARARPSVTAHATTSRSATTSAGSCASDGTTMAHVALAKNDTGTIVSRLAMSRRERARLHSRLNRALAAPVHTPLTAASTQASVGCPTCWYTTESTVPKAAKPGAATYAARLCSKSRRVPRTARTTSRAGTTTAETSHDRSNSPPFTALVASDAVLHDT